METNDPTDEEVGVRDQFVLQYAEILALDQNLWRIELEYLISCGLEGSKRSQALLARVAAGEGAEVTDSAVGGEATIGKVDGEGKEVVVTEVLEICAQLGMESLAREICQVRSQFTLSTLCATTDTPLLVSRRSSDVAQELRRSSVVLRSS